MKLILSPLWDVSAALNGTRFCESWSGFVQEGTAVPTYVYELWLRLQYNFRVIYGSKISVRIWELIHVNRVHNLNFVNRAHCASLSSFLVRMKQKTFYLTLQAGLERVYRILLSRPVHHARPRRLMLLVLDRTPRLRKAHHGYTVRTP